jgi:hypothetical protein
MEALNHSTHGKNVIFLISQPRAGSTMFQLMLSGSADIATTAEPWIALHPIFAVIQNTDDPIYGAENARMALLDFLKESGVDLTFYKKQIATLLQSLYNQAIKHQQKKYFLDKTPRYYHILDQLLEIFPGAKFLILFRNPMAVLNSILKTWVKDDLSFLANCVDDLILAPRKLVYWAYKNPNRCLKVHYEGIVSDPVMVLKKTCKFLNISYSDEMLHYTGRLNPDWKFGDQVGVYQFTQPTSDLVDKWKDDFKSDQNKLLAYSYLEALGPKLVKEMGYSYDDIKSLINLPDVYSQNNMMPWKTIANVIEGFSNIKDVRRAAFCAMMEEKLLVDSEFSNDVWSDFVRKMVNGIIFPKVNQMTAEHNRLETMADSYRNKISMMENKISMMENKISMMENTLSWKITAPLRESKLLRGLISHFKK